MVLGGEPIDRSAEEQHDVVVLLARDEAHAQGRLAAVGRVGRDLVGGGGRALQPVLFDEQGPLGDVGEVLGDAGHEGGGERLVDDGLSADRVDDGQRGRFLLFVEVEPEDGNGRLVALDRLLPAHVAVDQALRPAVADTGREPAQLVE